MSLYDHLISRNFNPDMYVNKVMDEDNNVLTVFLPNLNGQFVGFQQYRPDVTFKRLNKPSDARYFTYCRRGVTVCWGLETLDPSKPTLYIVEGIFKASALHMLGHNALALLTSHPYPMQSWLHTLPYNLIGIGDNDEAGDGMIEVAGKGFKAEKDLDEYSLNELKGVLDAF